MENRAIFSGKLLPLLLILPQLAISLIFFYWPALQALQQSFLVQDAFGLSTQFVWFENYVDLLQRPDYYQAIGVTFVFSALVVFFSLSLGLLFAAMANRNSCTSTPSPPLCRLSLFSFTSRRKTRLIDLQVHYSRSAPTGGARHPSRP